MAVTTFTDPMMGLSWEMEPVYRKLETHFGEALSFRYRMGLLVPDVMRLVDPGDLSLGTEEAIRRYDGRLAQTYLGEEAIRRYDGRLAQTYLGEEAIGGLPIVMDGFRLFSAENTSTELLCLAYEAVRSMAPDRADGFLYALRYATVVETRPTTQLDEILAVARRIGLDIEELEERIGGPEAHEALVKDLSLANRLGIHALPTVLLTYGERGMLMSGLAGYEAFCETIKRLTGGKVLPHDVVVNEDALKGLLASHPLMSCQEVRKALDLPSDAAARRLAEPLVEAGGARFISVKDSWFLSSR